LVVAGLQRDKSRLLAAAVQEVLVRPPCRLVKCLWILGRTCIALLAQIVRKNGSIAVLELSIGWAAMASICARGGTAYDQF
jgi:hypothetical protein